MLWYITYKLHVLIVQLYNTLILANILTGLRMALVTRDLRDYTALFALGWVLLWCILSLVMIILSSLIFILMVFYFSNTLCAGRRFKLYFAIRRLLLFMIIIVTYCIRASSFFGRMSYLFNFAWLMYLDCILTVIFYHVYFKSLSFIRVVRYSLSITLKCVLWMLGLLILIDQVLQVAGCWTIDWGDLISRNKWLSLLY